MAEQKKKTKQGIFWHLGSFQRVIIVHKFDLMSAWSRSGVIGRVAKSVRIYFWRVSKWFSH